MMGSLGNWLRAIRDCGVLRVTFDNDALVEAWELGLVDASPATENEDALDFRLTAEGLRAVKMQVAA